MSSISTYFLLLPLLLFYKDGPDLEGRMADTNPVAENCRKVVEYQHTRKILEGMVCNDQREGVWKEWYVDGRLKDSAVYANGARVYAASAVKKARGALVFRGNPKQFYQDSTYECSVKINTYHGIKDIKGDYDGVPDTMYPPLFYFGADMGARDEYQYYFTPKAVGKYKLRISLTGDAATAGGAAPFYEQEVDVYRK